MTNLENTIPGLEEILAMVNELPEVGGGGTLQVATGTVTVTGGEGIINCGFLPDVIYLNMGVQDMEEDLPGHSYWSVIALPLFLFKPSGYIPVCGTLDLLTFNPVIATAMVAENDEVSLMFMDGSDREIDWIAHKYT